MNFDDYKIVNTTPGEDTSMSDAPLIYDAVGQQLEFDWTVRGTYHQPGIDYGADFKQVLSRDRGNGNRLLLLHKPSRLVWGGRGARRVAPSIYALVERKATNGNRILFYIHDAGEVGRHGTWLQLKGRMLEMMERLSATDK
jgi:hypothetical protein